MRKDCLEILWFKAKYLEQCGRENHGSTVQCQIMDWSIRLLADFCATRQTLLENIGSEYDQPYFRENIVKG